MRLISTLQHELPAEKALARLECPRAPEDADLRAAVTRALAAPLDFPPLHQATIAGDQITLAVGPDLPDAKEIVAAVTQALLDTGARPHDITVLRTLDDGAGDTRDWYAAIGEEVQQIVHDPHKRRELAFLTHAGDQMPIYLSRALVDADVVLPIGCLRFAEADGYCGVHGVICPTFCDAETQRRFRGFHTTDSPRQHQDQAREKADEVAWLLGVLCTIQIVPASDDTVLEVLAGEPRAVARIGQQRMDSAWRVAASGLANLVIAAVAGGPASQTWDNFGRALALATELVCDDGAVAICCDLAPPPPPAFQQLVACDDPGEAIRRLRKDRLPHAVAATQLAQALKRAHVFLLSRLPAEDVEDLGVTPIADATEIARLARLHDNCVLIDGAQYAGPPHK